MSTPFDTKSLDVLAKEVHRFRATREEIHAVAYGLDQMCIDAGEFFSGLAGDLMQEDVVVDPLTCREWMEIKLATYNAGWRAYESGGKYNHTGNPHWQRGFKDARDQRAFLGRTHHRVGAAADAAHPDARAAQPASRPGVE